MVGMSPDTSRSKSEISRISISVRELKSDDVEKLDPILREHVRARDTGQPIESEIDAIKGYMCGGPDTEGRVRKYFVATESSGRVLGCVAVSTPDSDMCKHFSTDTTSSRELLNAFVTTEYFRGKGIGRQLFQQACDYAKSQGATQLLVNSGPRYQESWGFYDRLCDAAHGVIENKFGPGRDAKTWSKMLRA